MDTMAAPSPVEKRFWKYVVVAPGYDDCWEWIGAKRKHGYGQISSGRRVLKAHRVSYEIHFGPIPPGMSVLHSCDTPACVSPHHLSLGTQAENCRQAAERGRTTRVLSYPQALLIRQMASAGWAQRPLARKFGVDRRTIGRVLHYERPYGE